MAARTYAPIDARMLHAIRRWRRSSRSSRSASARSALTAAAVWSRSPLPWVGAPSLNVDELHVEDQHACGGARTTRLVAVRQVARNPEAVLGSLRHQLDAFGPALDDLIQAKGRRLAPHHGAVEHLPLRRPAGVVHRDAIGRLGVVLARALLQDLV